MERKIKEIILFCYGDSTKASTWSNVPYLMAKTFEEKGIKVNRVDIAPNRLISKIYNHTFASLHGAFYSWNRTEMFRAITNRKIKKAVKRYADSDYCIFLNFDFYNRFNEIPSLLFSDWTLEILLRDRKHVEPSKAEQRFMCHQQEAIEKAQLVIPLFQESSEKMKAKYHAGNIVDLGSNVVNDLNPNPLSENDILSLKEKSDYILFIGKPAYRFGLSRLIEALDLTDPGIKLHVIGMTENDLDVNNRDRVVFHGFLKKEDPEQNKTYYKLISGAKLIVNPSQGWGAYSSIIEGMHYYCPVIVSPFVQFVKEFGTAIDFGRYLQTNNRQELADAINDIFNAEGKEYREMCLKAHNRVADYTWSSFVDKMIHEMGKYNHI